MTLDLLESVYDVMPFGKATELYFRADKTPAHEFLYLYSVAEKDLVLEVDVRDFKDNSSLISFMKISKKYAKQVKNSLLKIDNVKFDNLPFNALILLPGTFTLEGSESKKEMELIKKTILSFPIYTCEFSGSETKEDVKLLRRDFIVTIDWKRRPCPIAKMRFNNIRTGVKSIGKSRGYTTINDVLIELSELKDEKSFIELENYKKEIITINYNKTLIIKNTDDNLLQEGKLKEAKEFVTNFLMVGL